MKRHKNTVTILLILSSILLLVVLQVLWLQSSYEKAFFDFRREANIHFRTTVLTMRDSLFIKSIEFFPGDSMPRDFVAARPLSHLHDADRIKMVVADSMMSNRDRKQRSAIQVIVSSGDSLQQDLLPPLVSRIQRIRMANRPAKGKSFILQLGQDTLNQDSLSYSYQEALVRAGISVPFKINLIRLSPREDKFPGSFPPFNDGPDHLRNREFKHNHPDVYNDTVKTDPVRVTPFNLYTADLTQVRGLLLQEITPQILFSLFLTITTVVAFIFMYRNIRSQQRLMEAKNDFINNITHELKTPVATVSVALEALKNFNALDNPKLSHEYLDIAQRELDRLSMMTDKILKTSIFESKGMHLEQERVDVDTMIQRILGSMKLVFEKRQVTVTYQKEGDSFELNAASTHLSSVIYNLIDNALKYSVQAPVIDIALKASAEVLMLSVKDNGIGIARNYHQKIFEKFFRVPTGDVHNIKGYGLGLNYVAGVVKGHQGTIKVISEPGKGSEFVIALPKKLHHGS